MDPSKYENARLALAGELFQGFAPELTAARARCKQACDRYNTTVGWTRRRQIELWRDIVQDMRPLPPPLADDDDEDLDSDQFTDEPWVEAPIRVDYGTNLRLSSNVYINFNCTILDSNLVTIGSRTLIASNVSLYSATHPLDPAVRNGTRGPELGKEIHIGSDCFIGGSVTVCPGVTIGNGSTVGAGSVVTKDVPQRCVVAGNPARILRWLDRGTNENHVIFNEVPKQKIEPPTTNNQIDGDTMPDDVNKKKWGQDGGPGNQMLGIRHGNGVPNNKDVESSVHSSAERTETQVDSDRLMSKQEWEDEMGRQIAESALSYGASLK